MAKKIFNTIARYALPAILGVATVLGVEKMGISQVYTDIEKEKAQVDYNYHNYTGAIGHEIGKYTARGFVDATAFSIPFILSSAGIGCLERLIRKKR